MLGAIFALLAAGLLGLLLLAAGDPVVQAGIAAAIAALLGYVAYAQRRSGVLIKEEAKLRSEEAERDFQRLSASALGGGVSVRWRARTFVLLIVLLVIAAAGVATGWAAQSWLMMVPSILVSLWMARTLQARLTEPEVLRVGSDGIEDAVRFGLIPWQDIESVHLHEYEVKGTKAATLSIAVRDPGAYAQRLGPVARFFARGGALGFGDDLRFPLQTLDMAPGVLFRLIRAFHERALPAGAAISGSDGYYRVDPEGGKLMQAMAELQRSFATDVVGSTTGQLELLTRMDALVKAHGGRLSATLDKAKSTRRRATVATAMLLLLFACLIGARWLGA